MADYRQINFDLYKVSAKKRDRSPVQIKSLFKKMPEFEPIKGTDGKIWFVGELKEIKGILTGTLVHNQMTGIPQTLNEEDGSIADLKLKQSQGLAHFTSFIFDPELSMLAIESKKKGVNINGLIRFIEFNTSPDMKLYSSVVLNPEDLALVRRFTTLRKFRVKIARISGGRLFANRRRSVGQLIGLADSTNTDTMEFELSMGRVKGSLDRAEVIPMIEDFSKYGENEGVESLVVKGIDPDDPTGRVLEIDLIKNRVILKMRMLRTRFDTFDGTSEKIGLAYDEYQKISGKLEEAYG